jgi:hypothetical protein
MNTDDFRVALAALLRLGASSGLDPFWLANETSLATMAFVDELRVDLVEVDQEPPPY